MVAKAWHKWIAWGRVCGWRAWTFVHRARLSLLVSAVFLALSVLTFATSQDDVGIFLASVSLIILVKSVGDVLRPFYDDLGKIFRTRDRVRAEGPLLFPYAEPYGTWQAIAAGNDEAVHHPALDAELALARIELRCDEELWLPRGEHGELRELKVSTLHCDEDKVRLQSDLVPGATKLVVRRTKYSAFLVTNRLASYTYRKRGSRRDYLSFAEVALEDGLLPSFPSSSCSNHIGVDVLCIADGRLILQRQSKHNQLNGDKIVGSGSGSADWCDLAVTGQELGEFVRYTMRREMAEELCLTESELPSLDAVKIVGYARLTSLAGKPQFYGVAKLGPVTERIHGYQALYVDEHWDIRFDPDDGADGLRAALNRVEDEFGAELAFTLVVNIQLIRQWLDADPTADTWLRAEESSYRNVPGSTTLT